MNIALTPLQSRLLAAAILVLALLALYGLVAWPLLAQYRAYDEAIADLSYRLGQYRRIAVQGAAFEASLADIERRQAASSYYLKSTKAALASAELQQHVKAQVDAHDGELVSSQVVPTETEDPFPTVALRVHMRGDIRTLRAVLHALEASSPVVFLDEVFITQAARRRNRRGEREAPKPLDIRFRVTGYTRHGNV